MKFSRGDKVLCNGIPYIVGGSTQSLHGYIYIIKEIATGDTLVKAEKYLSLYRDFSTNKEAIAILRKDDSI